MAVAQHMKPMELEGSLKAFKFPEILQFLAMGRMTGTLSLTQDDRHISLVFKNGKIIGASSDERCLRLGQMLVYAGRISRQALDEALEAQERNSESKRIGEILVERNLIDSEELKSVLKLQLEEEIWELFSWDNGYFRFEQGPVMDSEFVTVHLDVEPVLLEGSRRTDEWQAICATISNPGEVYRVNPDLAGSPEQPLEINTWKILSLINGSLSVEALVRLSNLGKFETYWALDHLIRNEIVVSTGSSVSSSAGETNRKTERTSGSIAKVIDNEATNPTQSRRDDEGGEKALISKLFGKKKASGAPSDGTTGSGAGSCETPRSGSEYFTDVGLVCAFLNHLIDRLNGETKFIQSSDPGNSLGQMWFEATQRFPKADLVEWVGNRLSADRFERYVVAEGSIAKSLTGAHDDAMEALKMFWNKLRLKAEERLEEKGAAAVIDKALRPYAQCPTPKNHTGEFSLSRWREAAA